MTTTLKPLAWVIALVASLTAPAALFAAELPPEPLPAPAVPVNLIWNGDFELDADHDGVPDRWYHSDPQYWCGPPKDSERWKELQKLWIESGAVPANIPFRPPAMLEGGTYRWEGSGFRSGHSISIDETTEQKWGEWDTIVKGIKPNTDYVVLGWRRQSPPATRKPGAAPWMKAIVFGQVIPIRGTISRDGWVPFRIVVNSGPFEGDCALGLVVEQTPAKVWIDKVAMFQGTPADLPRFRVGLKGAELEYPFHETAYASADMQCPLFFDLLWAFHNGNSGQPELEIVIDLPEGLDLTWSERGMGVRLSARDSERISIEGRPYVRRIFPVLSARESHEFDSAGTRPVRLWLKTEFKAGRFETFYHARWRGGSQPVQPLTIEILGIPKLEKQSKVLLAGFGGLSAELVEARANILVEDLPGTGINTLVLDAPLAPEAAEPFEKAGITPAVWFALGGEPMPEGAAAADISGKPVPGRLCPSYRASDAIKTVFAAPAKLVQNGSTTLFTDARNGLDRICFCARCAKEFQAFAAQRNPNLKYAPPAEFEAALAKPAAPGLPGPPDNFKELHALWVEFRSAKLAETYWLLRKSLDEFRKNASPPVRNAAAPLRFLAMVETPGTGLDAIKRGAMLDYAKMANVFDFEVIDPNMSLSDSGGTPAWVGSEVARLIESLGVGGKAGVVITAGSAENPGAPAPVIEHSDVRDQVLEAVVAGAKAVFLQPFYAVDGLDIKEFRDALDLLAPFDEIIGDGEPVKKLLTVEGKGFVRALGKDGQMLVLVSDYSPAPGATPTEGVKLALTFPEGAKRAPLVLVDVESAQVVARVPADAANFVAPLDGRRARLFYLGPQNKAPVKPATKR